VKQMQVARQVITGGLALGLLMVVSSLPVAAHAPEITRNTSFSYTLADSLADFANDPGSYEVDCGAFKVIATFDVTRTITTWPDRELRHVAYTGFFVNASDPSKMIPRNGTFERTNFFDANGDQVGGTTRGVEVWTVLDGRRVNLSAGLDVNENDVFTHHGLNRDATMICGPLS
jgi:hypothetical protein